MGLYINERKIVDASFVAVPRWRNTKEGNEKIKNGEGKDLWKDHPHKKRQKDIDARWTKKGGEKYYGYKDRTKVNNKSKLIATYVVTSAEVHDGKSLEALLREEDKGQKLSAGNAYIGDPTDEMLKK